MPLRQAVRQPRESKRNQPLRWGRTRLFSSVLLGFPEATTGPNSVYVSATYYRIQRRGRQGCACGAAAERLGKQERGRGATSNHLIELIFSSHNPSSPASCR